MDHREPLPIGAELIGVYRIEGVLGQGGFGVTYMATHMELGRSVAIKEYFPSEFGTRDDTLSILPKTARQADLFTWGRNRFLDEARTLARFSHPAIVRVQHVFEALNSAYMVLEFEAGVTISKWLETLQRRPNQEEIDALVNPLLDALEVMHSNNFIHRDIAPDNIIIRPDHSPVLLDFGSARQAIAEETNTFTGIIKAGYSPPEQYLSRSSLQGPWTDVYALGATLYRAVTGALPEEAPQRQLADTLRPAADSAGPGYRSKFLAAIDQALVLSPGERPQSVAEFRDLLFGDGATETARTARLSNPTPSGPHLMSVTASLLLIVLSTLAGVTTGYILTSKATTTLTRGFSCAILEAAVSEGVLTDAKRRELIGKVARSPALSDTLRQDAAALESQCTKLGI